MDNNQEKIIADFNIHARQAMEEHTVAIRQKYAADAINSEERLRVFNEHLNTLKLELQDNMKEILQEARTAEKDTSGVQARLTALYNGYINDFFKREF